MAKLFFKYSAMNVGKSTTLLQIVHNYEELGKNILVLKPSTDTKGNNKIVSRLGIEREVDFLITPKMNLFAAILLHQKKPIDCILIDEGQFLTKEQVISLSKLVGLFDIPIIVFGLKNNFKGEPFEGTSWLFALAQEIEELSTRTLCNCGKRGTMNVRKINGNVTFDGDVVGIDGEDNITYETICVNCFWKLQDEYGKLMGNNINMARENIKI